MFLKAFADKALQNEYEAGLASEKVRLTRVAVILATLINVAFVALDVWAIPSALATVWTLRAVMNLVLGLCLAATWHSNFQALYAPVTALLFFSLGSGINAMIYVAAPTDLALDAYYGGLLLTTFGVYTLTYVSFVVSIAISIGLIGSYTAISIFTHNFLSPDKVAVLAANLFSDVVRDAFDPRLRDSR